MQEIESNSAAALIQRDMENAQRYNALRNRAQALATSMEAISERLRNDPERLFFEGEPHPISAGLTVELLDPTVLDIGEMKAIRQELQELQRERQMLACQLHELGYQEVAVRKEPIRPRRLGL